MRHCTNPCLPLPHLTTGQAWVIDRSPLLDRVSGKLVSPPTWFWT